MYLCRANFFQPRKVWDVGKNISYHTLTPMKKQVILLVILFISTCTAFAQQFVIVDTVFANKDRCTLFADGDFWFSRNIHHDEVPCRKWDDGKTFLYCTDIDTAKFRYEYNSSQCTRLVVIRKRRVSFVDFVALPYYIDTLREGKTFDVSQQRNIPAFTYQSADAPELQSLRLKYNLDSVAGTGDEVTRILNVLHWVHQTIRHNGSAGLPPTARNAETIAQFAQKRGVNCRGLALFANECYLALGIRSRVVTCMPRNYYDNCHVINEVYSAQLGKWLWIDPTNEAYVMDDNQQMLSIFEVRERIIQDQPIVLNAEANWNNQYQVRKEYYLDEYMAKNLFYLSYILHSSYGADSRTSGNTIEFLRLEPLEVEQGKDVRMNQFNKFTLREYSTNNPQLLR